MVSRAPRGGALFWVETKIPDLTLRHMAHMHVDIFHALAPEAELEAGLDHQMHTDWRAPARGGIDAPSLSAVLAAAAAQ